MSRGYSDDEIRQLAARYQSTKLVAQEIGLSVRQTVVRLRKAGVPPLRNGYTNHQEPADIIYKSGRKSREVQDGTVIVFSDAHYFPGIVSTAHRALIHLIKELKPKVVVANGDVFDGASISRYPRIGWDNKPKVMDELRAVKARLAEVQDAAGKASLFWTLGNHDARFSNHLAQCAPQFEGVQGFELKDHFPDWIPCWSLWINSDTVIKHRHKNGIHSAHNSTVWAGKTMVCGHLHSMKVTPFSDYNGARFGVDCGTLADPYGPQFEDYTEDNPVNWRSGFCVLTFYKGRLLWPELCHVIADGQVEFRGRVIEV